MHSLTVVITNFGRAEFLRRALNSVINAGVRNIVVSSMCPGPEEAQTLAEFAGRTDVHCLVTSLGHDLGLNELWLRGLYYAPTPYVLILHDDDYLDPQLRKFWPDLRARLEDGCGLVSWRGSVDLDGNIQQNRYIEGPSRLTGTSTLTKILLSPEKGPISPVVSVFRRDDAIHFLKEAEASNRDPRQFVRPTAVLGNELLLYLRVCEKYRQWYYLDEALTYYGAHPGSITVANSTRKLWPKFLDGYNVTRAQFRARRALHWVPSGRILHVHSVFEGSNPETVRRTRFARATWQALYGTGNVLEFPVRDEMLLRSSKLTLGDTRSTPFLKDLFDYGCAYARPEDLVIYANSDCAAVPTFASDILGRFSDKTRGADFAWRHNFYSPLQHPLIRCDQGHKDGGVDLIAFRPEWWRCFRDYMPDMLIACEAWDWVLRLLIAESNPQPVGMDGLIYHEWHEPPYKKTGFRTTNPGQVHNINLARDFFISRAEPTQNLG